VAKPVWPLVLDSKVADPKVNDDTVTLDTRGVVTRVCEYSGIRQHSDGSQSQCGQCSIPNQYWFPEPAWTMWYYEAQRRSPVSTNNMSLHTTVVVTTASVKNVVLQSRLTVPSASVNNVVLQSKVVVPLASVNNVV
jgi:hypothetical protein